jgi:hypothetical protein
MSASHPLERISITEKGLAVLERLERRPGRPAPQQQPEKPRAEAHDEQ